MDLNNSLVILLTESIGQSLAYDAILNKQVVQINYEGDNDAAKGVRIIEPYVLGRTSSNNIAIRAFQPQGDTQSTVPNWKTFRLDRILSWKPTNQTFNQEPNKRGFNVAPYNPYGDGTLKSIRIQATFDDNPQTPNDAIQKTNSPSDNARNNLVNAYKNQEKTTNGKRIANQTNVNKQAMNDISKMNKVKQGNVNQNNQTIQKTNKNLNNTQEVQNNLKQNINQTQTDNNNKLDSKNAKNIENYGEINNNYGKQSRNGNERNRKSTEANGIDNKQGI